MNEMLLITKLCMRIKEENNFYISMKSYNVILERGNVLFKLQTHLSI